MFQCCYSKPIRTGCCRTDLVLRRHLGRHHFRDYIQLHSVFVHFGSIIGDPNAYILPGENGAPTAVSNQGHFLGLLRNSNSAHTRPVLLRTEQQWRLCVQTVHRHVFQDSLLLLLNALHVLSSAFYLSTCHEFPNCRHTQVMTIFDTQYFFEVIFPVPFKKTAAEIRVSAKCFDSKPAR